MLMRPVTLQNLHWRFGMSPRSWAHITNPRRVWSLQPNKQQYANDNEDSSATSMFLSRWTTLPKNFKSRNHDRRSNTPIGIVRPHVAIKSQKVNESFLAISFNFC